MCNFSVAFPARFYEFDEARHHLDLISRQWDQLLDRLKLSVENQED